MEKKKDEEFQVYRSENNVNWKLILSERQSVDSTIGLFHEIDDEHLITKFDNNQLIQVGVMYN